MRRRDFLKSLIGATLASVLNRMSGIIPGVNVVSLTERRIFSRYSNTATFKGIKENANTGYSGARYVRFHFKAESNGTITVRIQGASRPDGEFWDMKVIEGLTRIHGYEITHFD